MVTWSPKVTEPSGQVAFWGQKAKFRGGVGERAGMQTGEGWGLPHGPL